ncbi:MAG TPA: hypothetical protein VF533_00780 [Solirubrobacteraceae bacterium]|jgi:hypothetical protein
MLSRFRRPGHATVVAYLALFVALGGTGAYAANTIGSADVVDESLLSRDIKNAEVKSADINTYAVGNSELAPDAVGTGKIAAGAVGNTDLGVDAVTGAKVAPNTLTGTDIASNTLTGVDIDEYALGIVPAAAKAPIEGFHYEVEDSPTFDSTSPKTAEAACPDGERAIGGGASTYGENGEFVPLAIHRNGPWGYYSNYRWVVEAYETTATSARWEVTAWVICGRVNEKGSG